MKSMRSASTRDRRKRSTAQPSISHEDHGMHDHETIPSDKIVHFEFFNDFQDDFNDHDLS